MNTFFTTDGGDTWTEVNLGDAGDGLASNFRFDPAVIFDSAGNVYVAYGADLGPTTTLVVARSTNGGATYTNFAQLANNTDVGPPGNDKWMMATGSAPGAPASRRIYIAWTQNINEGRSRRNRPAPRRRVERGRRDQLVGPGDHQRQLGRRRGVDPDQRGPRRRPQRDGVRLLARRARQPRPVRPVDRRRRHLGNRHLADRDDGRIQEPDSGAAGSRHLRRADDRRRLEHTQQRPDLPRLRRHGRRRNAGHEHLRPDVRQRRHHLVRSRPHQRRRRGPEPVRAMARRGSDHRVGERRLVRRTERHRQQAGRGLRRDEPERRHRRGRPTSRLPTTRRTARPTTRRATSATTSSTSAWRHTTASWSRSGPTCRPTAEATSTT